jgi:alpha-ketoglutarate-dependent taurine dioxygenase
VTGWKGVFVNRGFTRRIQGVTKDESDVLLQYLFNVSLPVAFLHSLDRSLTKLSS